MAKTKTYRMRISTYRAIRKLVPAERNESLANYFERVRRFIEILKNGEKYDRA